VVAAVVIPWPGSTRDAYNDRLSVSLHGKSESQPVEPYFLPAADVYWPSELPGDTRIPRLLE